MRLFKSLTDPGLISCLNNGGVVVVPTDTVYGLVARASDKKAVERVYSLRGRSPEKPCIILVGGLWQITDNELWLKEHFALAKRYWPGPMSLVAPTAKTQFYLHRGTHTLAYRVPDYPELQKLLSATGPLIAPSANPQGLPTAATVQEAKEYFGDSVDGYVDGGTIQDRAPSTVVGIKDGKLNVFRQGTKRILLY